MCNWHFLLSLNFDLNNRKSNTLKIYIYINEIENKWVWFYNVLKYINRIIIRLKTIRYKKIFFYYLFFYLILQILAFKPLFLDFIFDKIHLPKFFLDF